jgi:hypothetical protein
MSLLRTQPKAPEGQKDQKVSRIALGQFCRGTKLLKPRTGLSASAVPPWDFRHRLRQTARRPKEGQLYTLTIIMN